MNRLFALKPLLVVTAALAIALVLACGGRGETTSPGSLLRLLPQNADSFTFADLEQLRDERLDNLEQQLARLTGEGRLEDWEIDLDDASSLVLSDPENDDALTILRGQFVVEDVEDALDDDGLRDGVHRDVTVWSERRGGVALAFVGEDVIVIGEEERVEDSIDVFIDGARSMDQDDEAEAIVDALEDGLVYSVAGDCSYRGCRRQGSAVRVEARDLVAVFAFLFRNDDAAADAEGDIEDDLEDLVDDPRTEADGEMVIAESPVDEDQLGLDRDGALAYRLEGDGPTRRRGGEERPTPTTERPRLGDDHGDDRSGATRIRDGEFLDGDIERDGDRDFFSFSAERGREYRIETHRGSNSDTVLVLYGPDGGYLDEDDDSGEDAASRLEWVAPSSDTYYIEVSGFDGTPGTYQLSLFELGRPRPGPTRTPTPTPTAAPAPTPTAAPAPTPTAVRAYEIVSIQPGEIVEGRIGDDDDRGYFEFRAQRGREYVIETHLGSISDTVLVLTGPGGLRLEDDDSGDGAASRMYWTAPESDEYLIEVKGFGGATGDYALSLTELERAPTPTPPLRDARYGGELALALAEEPFGNGYSPLDNYSYGANQIYSLIFSRLWRVSPTGIEPDLIVSWDLSEDGRVWGLELRDDARFHDGSQVTAQDVAYSIEAVFRLDEIPSVTLVDDYHLEVYFEEPNTDFVYETATSARAIVVSRDSLETNIRNFTDLVGSGPFVPAEHERYGGSVLRRNPDYYEDGLPHLDTVLLNVMPKRTTRTAAFQAGDIHFLGYPYSRTSSGHFPPLTNQEHATVSRSAAFGSYPAVFALWFDTRDPPFSDPRVRLAVNRAIDRNALEHLGSGEPQGPVPEAIFPAWRTRLGGPRELDEWNRYDPERARQLMAEAGYPDGFATSIQVGANAPQTWSDVAASVGEMLADLGIYADVVESDFNAPAEWGIKLAPVRRFGRDIDRFFIEHFGAGGEYNYSRTRLDTPLVGPNGLNSIIGLYQELAGQVYYIPLPAPLYARSESVRGPLWAELYDLGTTLRHVWLER